MKSSKKIALYTSILKIPILIVILSICFHNKSIAQCNYTIQVNKTYNNCNNQNIGQLEAIINGNGTFINSRWLDNNLDTVSSSFIATNITDGVYVFVVEDSITGCVTYSTSVLIDSTSQFQLNEKHVSCIDCKDGWAEINFLYSNNQETYSWDDEFLQTNKVASDLEEGFYSTSIQNQNCNLVALANINDCGSDINAQFNFVSPTCATCADGSIDAIISGGTPPYTLQWDDDFNQTTTLASNLRKNRNYMLTVTDTLNCSNIFFIDSLDFCQNNIFSLVNTTPPSCDTCSDGFAFINYNGIFPPLNHVWTFNGSTAFTEANLSENDYEVIITDSVGCIKREFAEIERCIDKAIANFDSIFILNEYNFSSNDITFNDNVNFPNAASYILTQKATYGSVSLEKNGSFNYTPLRAFSGIDEFSYCIFTDCGFSDTVPVYISVENEDMVWPGDANNDGFVNNFDVLPLARFLGQSGIPRANNSTNYQGFLASDFTLFQASGANIKHIDTDGSGSIDLVDLNTINLNYGRRHQTYIDDFSGNTPLEIEGPTEVNAGDTVEFIIKLGAENNNANNVYGLAYTFNINPEIIDKNYFDVRFNDSWFTPDNDRISISKAFLNKGKIDIAQSRYLTGTNISGDGDICSIIVVIEEDLGGVMVQNEVSLKKVKLIDNNENIVKTGKAETAFVINSIDDRLAENDFRFNINPNPAIENLQINFSKNGHYEIELFNVIGEQVFKTEIENKNKLALENKYENGIYFLTITKENNTSTQKVVFNK